MGRTNRIGLALAGLVVLMALLSAGLRLISVHQETSDWALWPKPVPSRVQFAGRDYHCQADAMLAGAAGGKSVPDGGTGAGPSDTALHGLAVRGKTAGGADIYASTDGVPPTIRIRSKDGVYSCALLGGP